jgi:hypothetical protein
MSQVGVAQCDYCKTRVDDAWATIGWIRLNDFRSISISGGRDSEQSPMSSYYSAGGADRDFCTRQCFLAWFDEIAASKKTVMR